MLALISQNIYFLHKKHLFTSDKNERAAVMTSVFPRSRCQFARWFRFVNKK